MPRKRASKSSRSEPTKSTDPTSATQHAPNTVRSSAYDVNFEQHFIDNGIYPVHYDYEDASLHLEPNNISEIKAAMAAPRPSLSPSQITPEQFRAFNIKNNTASEGTVMRTIIPMIAGDYDIPNEGHLPFTNLQSMTKEATVKPVPDFWDGSPPDALNSTLRDDKELNPRIIPTKHPRAPVAPNFFLEAKAPSGGVDVARRQAMGDGAYGARGMHSIKNYGLEQPDFDGNAYTYSSTYQAGLLKLYSHHPSAPPGSGDNPRYHMTQLRGYDLTDSRDAYREGTAAVRNIRDLAKRQRDQLIKEANARTSQSSHSYGEVSTPELQPFYDPPSQSTDYSAFDYLSTQDSQGGKNLVPLASAHDIETSLATSFTAADDNFDSNSRSKRVSSQSPPSASHRTKKSATERRRPRREPEEPQSSWRSGKQRATRID